MWMPSKTSIFLVESVEFVVPAPCASVFTISFATNPNEYAWICFNFDCIVLLVGSVKESIGLSLSDASYTWNHGVMAVVGHGMKTHIYQCRHGVCHHEQTAMSLEMSADKM